MSEKNKAYEQSRVCATAVYWYSRLHSSDVSDQDQQAFAAWLASDPAHSQQYQRVLEVWDAIKALPRHKVAQLGSPWSFRGYSEQALLRRSAWGYVLGLALCAALFFVL